MGYQQLYLSVVCLCDLMGLVTILNKCSTFIGTTGCGLCVYIQVYDFVTRACVLNLVGYTAMGVVLTRFTCKKLYVLYG